MDIRKLKEQIQDKKVKEKQKAKEKRKEQAIADKRRLKEVKAMMDKALAQYKPRPDVQEETQPKTTIKLKAEIVEVETAKKEVQLEIDKTEALQAKLDARREQIAIQKELDALNIKDQEEQIAILEQTVVNQEKLNTLSLSLSTLIQTYNELQSKLRQSLNLDRVFTHKQKRTIYLNAGGKCQHCGSEVSPKEWEADHIIPYIKGGTTTINNGQCLCRSCNRAKGGK